MKNYINIFSFFLFSGAVFGQIPTPVIYGPDSICPKLTTYSVDSNPLYTVEWAYSNLNIQAEPAENIFSVLPRTNKTQSGFITAKYCDGIGCGPEDTLFLQILPIPSIQSVIGLTTVCKGQEVKFVAKPDSLTPKIACVQYIWEVPIGTIISSQNDTAIIIRFQNQVVTDTVKVTAINRFQNDSCTGNSKTIIVTIEDGVQVPESNLIEKGNETSNSKKAYFLIICPACVGNSNITSKVWYYQDDTGTKFPMDSCMNNDFCKFNTRNPDYTYYLQLDGNSAGNPDLKCSSLLSIKVPRSSTLKDTPIHIIPNPNTGIFTIELEEEYIGATTIEIVDMVGNIQRSLTLEKSESVMKIPMNVSELKKGVYLIYTSGPDGSRQVQKALIY